MPIFSVPLVLTGKEARKEGRAPWCPSLRERAPWYPPLRGRAPWYLPVTSSVQLVY